ncbi:unnamed protein product [Leptidea sinapis]|uniref:Uncharacterized protein n=1 Tax=Leptidea sinapis TaxID=189913 RepID=A0A5E4QZ65_9NEOP|nr:unnamed protein product [Leptidea sinapis]
MASDLCHHCDTEILAGDGTELVDAEIFKGVIFCYSCCRRIFRGCYTAKCIKNKPRQKRVCHRRRDKGILEIARRNLSDSNSTSPAEDNLSKPPSNAHHQEKDQCSRSEQRRRKSRNVEITNVKRILVPIYVLQIAHMTLRRRSEALLVINSHIRALKRSSLRNDSGLSGDTEKWSDEGYSSQDTYRRHWLDRRLGSLLKMPYVFFKENILARSSMISVMLTNRAQKKSALKRLKYILHDEIACHQSRGVKQLMSKDLGYRCMRLAVYRRKLKKHDTKCQD